MAASTPAFQTRLLIDNEDRMGEGQPIRIVNPATEELVAEFPGDNVGKRIAATWAG